jgi:hypothetical protein
MEMDIDIRILPHRPAPWGIEGASKYCEKQKKEPGHNLFRVRYNGAASRT